MLMTQRQKVCGICKLLPHDLNCDNVQGQVMFSNGGPSSMHCLMTAASERTGRVNKMMKRVTLLCHSNLLECLQWYLEKALEKRPTWWVKWHLLLFEYAHVMTNSSLCNLVANSSSFTVN
jgi:hypothetical protein